MKVSYDCEELIEELKKDIEEFGDIEFYSITEDIEINSKKYRFITNYAFIENEKEVLDYIKKSTNHAVAVKIKGKELLEKLKEQNKEI